MPALRVTSEIGQLEAVLVHTPGAEIRAVTPGNKGDYLYDDIIQPEIAQKEHRRFVAVLQRFATVYQVADLLASALERPEARDYFVRATLDVVPSEVLGRQLNELEPKALARVIIEGVEQEGGPLARALNAVGYALPPLPNLFFPRDIGAVIGSHGVVGSMRHGVRWTEELLVKMLFAFHPALENAGILYDGSEERRNNFTLEGGDLHLLRPDLLVVGFSERSTPAAIDHLSEVLFQRTERDRHPRRGDAQGADGHSPRHAVHPGGPGPVRGLSPLFHRPRAAGGAAPQEGPRRRPRDAGLLHRAARGGAGPGPDSGRGHPAGHAGAGAVDQRLQLPGAQAGDDRELPAQRGDHRDAQGGRLPAGVQRGLRGLRRLARHQAPHRHHHRRGRAGAWRRRSPLHDPAAPARSPCDRADQLSRADPGGTRHGADAARAAHAGPAGARRARRWRAPRRWWRSGWPWRSSRPTRGCASWTTGAGRWWPRPKARRSWRTAASRWWTWRRRGCAPRAPTASPTSPWWWCMAPAASWCSSRWSTPASPSRTGSPCSPASATRWSGSLRRSRRSWTRCWRRSPAGSSWPTTPGSTGAS